MNTQTMVSYLQSSIDKRSNEIKKCWGQYWQFFALKEEARHLAPGCIGHWRICMKEYLNEANILGQKQKIEKKLIAELICLNYFRKHGLSK